MKNPGPKPSAASANRAVTSRASQARKETWNKPAKSAFAAELVKRIEAENKSVRSIELDFDPALKAELEAVSKGTGVPVRRLIHLAVEAALQRWERTPPGKLNSTCGR